MSGLKLVFSRVQQVADDRYDSHGIARYRLLHSFAAHFGFHFSVNEKRARFLKDLVEFRRRDFSH